MGEKIWHLEKRVMEQRVEEMMMAETLTKTRSELKGLKERWRTLSSLLDSEEYWIETVGVVSVCVAIGDSLPLTAAGVLSCVLTAQYRAAGEHTLRGSHQYLGHYGRWLAIAETLSCVSLFRVYTADHRGCSQQEEVWPRGAATGVDCVKLTCYSYDTPL